MEKKDDWSLLRAFVERADEDAFTVLVGRHVNMVYSAALRSTGNPDQAEEITQAVFVVFARKAHSLRPRTVVGGWLFHAARLAASNFLRNEARRQRREQEFSMQTESQEEEIDVWPQVAPLLNDAVASLGGTDRDAVVLRYLEGMEFKEVGAAIGANEEAAKKRVQRALDKLRAFFTKRGVVVTGATLAISISANSASAAPAALAKSITGVGALKGASVGASTLAIIEGTLKVMAWAKLKVAATIGTGMALATGGVIVAVHYTAEASHDRNEVATLSHESPFVRHLSNPPWVKTMRYARGYYEGPGPLMNTNAGAQSPTWVVVTNIFGVQPSGSYISMTLAPGQEVISGVDGKDYWTAMVLQKTLTITPVAPEATFRTPAVEGMRSRIDLIRHLGLPALRQGTFAVREGGKFTATMLAGEALEGRILKMSRDRPLALTYHYVISFSPTESREFTATVAYNYASATAPLPESFDYSITAKHRRRFNGIETVEDVDRSAMTSTFSILSADYGLDESITNGYPPSRFLPDLAQYKVQMNMVSNGITYIDGVAQPLGYKEP